MRTAVHNIFPRTGDFLETVIELIFDIILTRFLHDYWQFIMPRYAKRRRTSYGRRPYYSGYGTYTAVKRGGILSRAEQEVEELNKRRVVRRVKPGQQLSNMHVVNETNIKKDVPKNMVSVLPISGATGSMNMIATEKQLPIIKTTEDLLNEGNQMMVYNAANDLALTILGGGVAAQGLKALGKYAAIQTIKSGFSKLSPGGKNLNLVWRKVGQTPATITKYFQNIFKSPKSPYKAYNQMDKALSPSVLRSTMKTAHTPRKIYPTRKGGLNYDIRTNKKAYRKVIPYDLNRNLEL